MHSASECLVRLLSSSLDRREVGEGRLRSKPTHIGNNPLPWWDVWGRLPVSTPRLPSGLRNPALKGWAQFSHLLT